MDSTIIRASLNKCNFIQLMKEVEIIESYEWVEGWLTEYWTDEMSQVFFEQYWNGSFDYEILDDIEKCMIDFTQTT